MTYLYFECSGQEMTWLNPGVKIVSNSVEIYECVFTFNEDWEGFNKIGVFSNGTTNDSYKRDLIESSCRIPPEVLTMPGDLYIGVVGTKENKVMPTIKTPTIRILEGIGNGEFSEEPDPTILAQLNNAIATLFDSVASLDKTVKYKDLTWNFSIPPQQYGYKNTVSIESLGIPSNSITGINILHVNQSVPAHIVKINDINGSSAISLEAVRAAASTISAPITAYVIVRIYYLE